MATTTEAGHYCVDAGEMAVRETQRTCTGKVIVEGVEKQCNLKLFCEAVKARQISNVLVG